MPRGGAHPPGHNGPKKGAIYKPTLDKIAAREALRELVMAHMAPMAEAQIANAKGLKYLVTRGPDGKFVKVTEAMAGALKGDEIIEVWEKEPSVQAFTDLMNRALDKPQEPPQDLHLHLRGTLREKIDKARQRGNSRD